MAFRSYEGFRSQSLRYESFAFVELGFYPSNPRGIKLAALYVSLRETSRGVLRLRRPVLRRRLVTHFLRQIDKKYPK